MNFWNLLDQKTVQRTPDANFLKLAIISGNFPKSGIALPFGNRRLRTAALKELYLYKGKDFWSKTKINLLRVFNFSFVWNLVFKKKYLISSDPAKENIFLFLQSQMS